MPCEDCNKMYTAIAEELQKHNIHACGVSVSHTGIHNLNWKITVDNSGTFTLIIFKV